MLWTSGTVLSIVYAGVQYAEVGSCLVLLMCSAVNLICQISTIALVMSYRGKSTQNYQIAVGTLEETFTGLEQTKVYLMNTQKIPVITGEEEQRIESFGL